MSNEACITPSFLVNELPSFYHSIFDHLSYSDTDPLLRVKCIYRLDRADLYSCKFEWIIRRRKYQSSEAQRHYLNTLDKL